MHTVEVSIEVLWDAVERTATSDFDLVNWWKHKTRAANPQTTLHPFQKDTIAKVEPKEWDISVLSYAIRNCDYYSHSDRHAPLRECAEELKQIRNSLFHKRKSQIGFKEYIGILQSSIKNYETLLVADDEACGKYVKQLKSINNCESEINVLKLCMVISMFQCLHNVLYCN